MPIRFGSIFHSSALLRTRLSARCGVLQRRQVLGQPGPPRHAVFQEHARDAERIEPLGHILALMVDGQDVVAAARADDHGRAGVLVGRRLVERDRRLGHVGHAADRLRLVLGRLELFRPDVALFARRLAGPETQHGTLGRVALWPVFDRATRLTEGLRRDGETFGRRDGGVEDPRRASLTTLAASSTTSTRT